MAVVVTCTDPLVLAGQPASDCGASYLVFKEETTFWDPALSLEDVADLLSAVMLTFALVWGFRLVARSIFNR